MFNPNDYDLNELNTDLFYFLLYISFFTGMYKVFECWLFTRRLHIAKSPSAFETELNIPLTKMLGTNILKIHDDEEYWIAFAYKRGFRLPFFSHTALGFYDPKQGKWLIIGRQSPALVKEGRASKIATYQGNHFFKNLRTHIDNEKNYDLFPDSLFNGIRCQTKINGKALKQVIQNTNKVICDQFLNFYDSNCSSVSIYMLTEIILILHKETKTVQTKSRLLFSTSYSLRKEHTDPVQTELQTKKNYLLSYGEPKKKQKKYP